VSSASMPAWWASGFISKLPRSFILAWTTKSRMNWAASALSATSFLISTSSVSPRRSSKWRRTSPRAAPPVNASPLNAVRPVWCQCRIHGAGDRGPEAVPGGGGVRGMRGAGRRIRRILELFGVLAVLAPAGAGARLTVSPSRPVAPRKERAGFWGGAGPSAGCPAGRAGRRRGFILLEDIARRRPRYAPRAAGAVASPPLAAAISPPSPAGRAPGTAPP